MWVHLPPPFSWLHQSYDVRLEVKMIELFSVFCAVLCTTVVHNDMHTRVWKAGLTVVFDSLILGFIFIFAGLGLDFIFCSGLFCFCCCCVWFCFLNTSQEILVCRNISAMTYLCPVERTGFPMILKIPVKSWFLQTEKSGPEIGHWSLKVLKSTDIWLQINQASMWLRCSS